MSSIFERFSESAERVVILAQEAARLLKHNYIGTEHLLLALLREEGLAARALNSFDVTPERVTTQVERIVGVGREPVQGQIPFTPRSKKVLELATREALSLRHDPVEPAHILLGLVRENEGVGPQILRDFEADADAIRRDVLTQLDAAPPTSPPDDEDESELAATAAVEEAEEETEVAEAAEEGPDAIPTHADRPATRDELGRARLAEVLGERMRRVRGENTEAPTDTRAHRRRKRREDHAAARQAGSFMVHIHAPWGAGKSSLLNFLARDLRNRQQPEAGNRLSRLVKFVFRPRHTTNPQLSRWIVVEFSAWEHQRLATPWWWLLAAVQRSCGHELWQISRTRWAWFWIRDLAWRLWNARAALFAALLIGAIVILGQANDWFGLNVSSLTALQTAALTVATVLALATTLLGIAAGAGRWLAIGSAEGAVRFLRRAHDPLGVYRRRFRWLVRSSGQPITVFIDDLDRCRASYVVELLEGIQTIFAGEPVTYVVAADRTWLCRSFSQGYQDFEDIVGELGRPLGFLFLEKTFQISMEIPPMSSRDREDYWAALMRGADRGPAGSPTASSAKPDRDAFASVATQAEVEDRIGDLLSAGTDSEQVLAAAMRRLNAPDMQEQLENLLAEFAPLLEKNPRSMKRLMNAYGIERDRLLRDGLILTKAQRRQLILLTILRLRWPLLSDHLHRLPDEVKFCTDGHSAPVDHPFVELFSDAEVRKLFDGSHVEERLAADLFVDFPSSQISSTTR